MKIAVALIAAGFVASFAAAKETVAWPIETRQLLDIEVHELAWPLVLVAVNGLQRLQPRTLRRTQPVSRNATEATSPAAAGCNPGVRLRPSGLA